MAEPAQPQPSWAELSTRLGGLLERLETPCSEEDSHGMVTRCTKWLNDVDARMETAVGQAERELGQAEREALARTVCHAGERLAALETRPEGHVTLPACELIAGCSVMAKVCRLGADELSRFAVCMPFLLNRGALALESIARYAAAPLLRPVSKAALERALDTQVSALSFTVALMRSASSPATARRLLPPQRVLRWLAAAAGALEAVERGGPGHADVSINDDVLMPWCFVIYLILSSRPFEGHLTAVRCEGALCARLALLMLPFVAATAAGLQLPQERRPFGCTSRRASHLAYTMFCLASAPGAQQLLAEAGCIPRLLQLAMLLALHAPEPDAEDLINMLRLLGLSARFSLNLMLARNEEASPQAAQLAQQLLETLPKFAAVLPSAGMSGEMSEKEMLWICLGEATRLLQTVQRSQPPGAFSLENAEAWCTAAAAALRLLADLATAGHTGTGQLPAAAAAGASRSVCSLAQSASSILLATLVSGDSRPAAAAAVLAAAWQLHSWLCRAVHAGADAAGALTKTAAGVLLAAERASKFAAAASPMKAMSAAQFELLRAVLLGPSATAAVVFTDAEACSTVMWGLSSAVRRGPAAIAAHPDTEAMFSRLLAAILSQDVPVLGVAKDSAPEAAHLLLCGVYDQALQRAHTLDADEALMLMRATMRGVRALCSALEPSSRTLAASLEQPAAALRVALSAPAFARAAVPNLQPGEVRSLLAAMPSQLLPLARQLAAALLQWWRRPEQAEADALELARAAAARSCAYLRCANLTAEGGPAARTNASASKCSGCRAVWYCNETCSHANWRGPLGHKLHCHLLGAERVAAKAAAAAERRQAGGGSGAIS